jgi:hypothetical protein
MATVSHWAARTLDSFPNFLVSVLLFSLTVYSSTLKTEGVGYSETAYQIYGVTSPEV